MQALAQNDDADGLATTIGGYGVGYGLRNRYGRVFVPGAFAVSITQLQQELEAKPLPIGWMHDLPIGKWTTLEDREQGPYLEGPLSQTSTGEDAAILVRDGLSALSIGFDPTDENFSYMWAEPNQVCSFNTPYGARTYQFDDYTIYIITASLVECSLVLVGADDDARITLVQSLLAKADRALPGLTQGAGWEDVAYSMALVMGGRGANSFQELPELEHRALYQRLAEGYAKFDKTPPPYERRPDYRDVQFQSDERSIFQDRYLRKTLAAATAGAAGIEGQLSPETREEALRLVESLTGLTERRDAAQLLEEMQARIDHTTQSLRGTTTDA